MGVDYRANYGIGFKVNLNSGDCDFHLGEHLEEVLDGNDYRYFRVGCGNYTGEDDDYFVVLESVGDLSNLKELLEELKSFLLEKQLISEDQEADLVGGLYIY